MREANWAGTHTYGAHALHRPTSLDEVREVLARAPHVRVLGSRHAFTDLADAPELVSLEGLAADVEVDRAASTVSFAAGLHYGELATALEDEDVALHNLPSLPHVCVAGAVATATHGSGDAHGNLATAVAGLQLVTPAGDVVTAARDGEDFEGLVVGLGGLDPENCSAQLGVPGPWWDRLPHFRFGFTPSSGEELQSEFHVPRAHARAAIEAMRGHAGVIRPVLQVSELRSVAADGLWMSPQYDRDTLALHFTWRREPAAVRRALAPIEAALDEFGARPHWGKLFLADAPALARRYERHADFLALAARLDSRGAFRNAWFDRCVGG